MKEFFHFFVLQYQNHKLWNVRWQNCFVIYGCIWA